MRNVRWDAARRASERGARQGAPMAASPPPSYQIVRRETVAAGLRDAHRGEGHAIDTAALAACGGAAAAREQNVRCLDVAEIVWGVFGPRERLFGKNMKHSPLLNLVCYWGLPLPEKVEHQYRCSRDRRELNNPTQYSSSIRLLDTWVSCWNSSTQPSTFKKYLYGRATLIA